MVTSLSNRKRVSIIGFGKQSQKDIVPALNKLSNDIEITDICDIDNTQLKIAQTYFPKANLHRDYKDILTKKSILDFVILCLPHDQYYPVVKNLLKNNIAIFKEKPFARTFNEGLELHDLSIEYRTPIYILEQRRCSDRYIKGKELMKLMTKPYMFEVNYFFPYGTIYSGWRSDKEKAGGGVVIDMGYHIIDLLIWYFGLPDTIFCLTSNSGKPNSNYNVEDSANMILGYQNGLHGVVQLACLSGPKDEMLVIRGCDKTVEIHSNKLLLKTNQGKIINKFTFKDNTIKATERALTSYISAKRLSNSYQHLQHMAFIEAAYCSRQKNIQMNPHNILISYTNNKIII